MKEIDMGDLNSKELLMTRFILRRVKLVLTVLILFIAGARNIMAQGNGSVTGVVLDAQTGETLIGANVFIEGTSNGTATNIEGEFILTNVPPESHTLKISYIGYNNKTIDIIVAAGKKTVVNIEIAYSGIELGAVEITAQARGQLSAINNQLNSQDIRNVVLKGKINWIEGLNE